MATLRSMITAVIAFACSSGAGLCAEDETTPWTTFLDSGEAAFIQDHIAEASRQYKSALAEAEKQKVKEDDPRLQKLLMDDLPDLIERICQDKEFDRAEDLAMVKLNAIEKMFGNSSAYVLDAMQDLQLIYAQQKKTDMVTKVLMRYAGVTNTLREAGKISQVENVEQLRKQRLQRQLRERFERIQRRFEPVN